MIPNTTVLKRSAAFSNHASADTPSEQHSLGQSILLHLLPGAIATTIYVLSVPFFTGLGYPSITALYLPMILAVILMELGYLLYLGKKKNGFLSLKGIVDFRQPVPWWMYIAFPLLLLVWGIFGTALVSPIDNLLLNRLFAWLPDWYALRNLLQIKEVYPRAAILVTAGCALILNGIAGPIVEELYFRGYLLPRLSRFGYWAPLLNVALFSLYHLWTPWMFFSRIVLLVPMVYFVWWRRNIYIGIIAHCLLNLIGTIVLFVQLLG
ncbi:MAG TPA: type II CAAX endopeptidase family protein [Anaerolineales bacterium]|nr:type II CAAX endopeptidase family protein [Anaerolineales bacterium]